jgi:hypothetical protein
MSYIPNSRSFKSRVLAAMLAAASLLAACGSDESSKDTRVATSASKPLSKNGAAEKSSNERSILGTNTPELTDVSDGVAYELGTRFRTTVDGRITAIRYWKAPSEVPSDCAGCARVSHTGKIWTADDANPTVLATAFFTDETSSGWQEARLVKPLYIQKDSVYIVSVEANSHYVATNHAFDTDFIAGPLVIPAGGGVYGPKGNKPAQSFRNTSYFRDIVFEPLTALTIFTNETPHLPDASDGAQACSGCPGKAYELGTRFVPAVDGEIIGIRYWRAPSETLLGSESTFDNEGRIWSEQGELLATVGFPYQWPRSGWHYAELATPLNVQAGKQYVVSVYSNSHYAITIAGLAASVGSDDVTAVVGGGVFGDPRRFPTNSWQNSNYFRDVLFRPAAGLVALGSRLPRATQNQSYSFNLEASGGLRPYTWRIASGQLPSGLTLRPDGLLAGTPNEVGATDVSFEVADARGATATTAPLTLQVVAGLGISSLPALPEGRLNQSYRIQLQAEGGLGGYTWNIARGDLNPGLSLTLDGQVTGRPRVPGTTSFTLRVTDRLGASAERTFSLTVLP